MDLIRDQNICKNQTLTLHAGNWESYLWSNGQITPSVQINKTGLYWVEVLEQSCIHRDTFEIKYAGIDTVLVSASANQITTLEPVNFLAVGESAQKWDFGDGTEAYTSQVQHAFSQAGEFVITVKTTNEEGCTAIGMVVIQVEPTLPNVFTPNGDGFNDVFEVEYNGNKPIILSVCNRMGKLVYTSIGKNTIYWSGDGQTNGIYYYYLVIDNKTYHGWLHLLR